MHSYMLSLFFLFLCVFCAIKLSLSKKKKETRIVRLNTSHVRSVGFLAFCFTVHTGLLFFSVAFYSRKAMHLLYLSFFFFSLLLFWFDDDDDDDCVYGMHCLICLSLICDRWVYVLSVFARSFWWSLYICTDKENKLTLQKKEEFFPFFLSILQLDSCSHML